MTRTHWCAGTVTASVGPADVLSGAFIAPDDPRAGDVRALLARHLATHTSRPRLKRCALNIDALIDPSVTLLRLSRRGALLRVAALKRLDDHAEIKSMHAAQAARGWGIG